MILYTKLDCPLCTVVKTKLKLADIDFTECLDEQQQEKLGIDTLPVAEINGKLLEFKEILDYIKEVAQ